jgi:hypothetical protein
VESISRTELQTYLTPAELAAWEQIVVLAETDVDGALRLETGLRSVADQRRAKASLVIEPGTVWRRKALLEERGVGA